MRTTHYALPLLLLFISTTVFAQVPSNDNCSAAIPILCGEAVTGNTTEATADANAITCGTPISAPGIWYSFEGNDQAVLLSTCTNAGYDTKINVYRGSCGALICVAGNDDDAACGTGSTIGFVANSGVSYLILVQGFNSEVGEFELTAECGPLTSDFCGAAEPIACNQSLSGSTLQATIDAAQTCGTAVTAPGVWYTFTGVSDQIVLSTCEFFDFDTKLSVYSGSCGTLTCVGGNDDTPGVGTCSTVNFVADPALTYYILVHGFQTAVGDFMLGMTCIPCRTPTAVSASASNDQATVYWQSNNSSAAYTIEYGPTGFAPGAGTVITGPSSSGASSAVINGLDAATGYDFYLTEECGPGENSLRVGPIGFTTLTDPPPANSNCAGAIAISCGMDLEGNTSLSIFTPGPTCGSASVTSRSLWYTLVGNGETATLSMCGAASFDSKLSVFTGDCGSLVCVAGVDDAPDCILTSEVSFPTVDGTNYLVLVHGFNQGVGTFTLSMTCEPTCSPIAANDECSGAISLTPVGLGLCIPIEASNACAFAPGVPNPPCDPFSPIVDVWFTFNSGEQNAHSVLLEALTATELNAALYQDCGSMTFVSCRTNIAGPETFTELELNTTYYLRVWNGGAAQAGTFNVCIEADMTTAVAEASDQHGVRIWPNPANDQLMIEGADADRIAVIDLQGRVVLATSTNKAALVGLSIDGLAPGSYILRSMDANGRTIGRFIKE